MAGLHAVYGIHVSYNTCTLNHARFVCIECLCIEEFEGVSVAFVEVDSEYLVYNCTLCTRLIMVFLIVSAVILVLLIVLTVAHIETPRLSY
jgi:hypothetical protein